MIIDSGTKEMQSTRSYQSIKKASARGVRGTITGGKDSLDSLFENQLGTGEKTAGEEKDDSAKLEDLSCCLFSSAKLILKQRIQ